MRSGSKLDHVAGAISVFATFVPIAERVADHPRLPFDVVLELMDVPVNPDIRSPGLDEVGQIAREGGIRRMAIVLG